MNVYSIKVLDILKLDVKTLHQTHIATVLSQGCQIRIVLATDLSLCTRHYSNKTSKRFH